MNNHSHFQFPEFVDKTQSQPQTPRKDGSSTSAIPFPSISASAAASPAAGGNGSKGIPRPPNAWILYRSHKLEQLKQEELERAENDPHSPPGSGSSPPRGALTAGVLSWLAASSGDFTTRRSTSPAATPSTTANTPAASAHSPATPGPSTGNISASTPISSLIAQLWRSESDEVKQTFYELAKEKQEEHKRLWPTYKYQPRITPKSILSRERRRTNSGGETAQSPSVASPDDVFQVPSLPMAKSRTGSVKRPRKSSGVEFASSPYSEASPVEPATPSRKRRTPEVGSPSSPTPRGRRVAKSARSRGRQSSRGMSPRCSTYKDTEDALPSASPADLTLLPSTPSMAPDTLSPTSWALRDAQALSTMQATPMPPALPPSERTTKFSDGDGDAGSRINVYEYFTDHPSLRNLPIQPGTELFELDPALGEQLDFTGFWRDRLGKDAELFDWDAAAADEEDEEWSKMGTGSGLANDEWLKTVDWDRLAPGAGEGAIAPSTSTLTTQVDTTAMMHDLTQYILSQAEGSRSGSPAKSGHIQRQDQSASPTRKTRLKQIRPHVGSPSQPPSRCSPPPPVPRRDCNTPEPSSPFRRSRRTRRRPPLPSSVHSSPIRAPPSPSPTPSSESGRVLRSSRGRPRVARGLEVRREVGLESRIDMGLEVQREFGLDSNSAGHTTIQQPDSTHCASPSPTTTITTADTKSSSSATPATTSTSFELHGSYTEDELMDMLARRRLERRGGM